MKKYSIIASVVTVAAVLFSNVLASFLWTYQPQTPKCFK